MTKSHKATVAYDHQIFAYQRFGGVSRYITELATRVPTIAPIETCIVAPIHINVPLSECSAKKFGKMKEMGIPAGQAIRGVVNRVTSALVMQIMQPALVHWTYFNPTVLPRRSKSVVTVYDMVHELFPNEFNPADSTKENKRNCVLRADHVICISENTKSDLMRLAGVPTEKITVTHLGFSGAFHHERAGDAAPASSRPYVLYVGQRNGYKGFADAIRAFGTSERLKRELDFVLFGGPELHPAELELFRSLGLRPDGVRRLEGNDLDLARFYRSAHLFVYPSKYEGFGIPPLEAMACGCPVACANTSSIPEVVGDAAILFDPYDQDAMRDALEAGCFDTQLRAQLVQAGHARAALFSWDRCARETAQVYSRVLGLS